MDVSGSGNRRRVTTPSSRQNRNAKRLFFAAAGLITAIPVTVTALLATFHLNAAAVTKPSEIRTNSPAPIQETITPAAAPTTEVAKTQTIAEEAEPSVKEPSGPEALKINGQEQERFEKHAKGMQRTIPAAIKTAMESKVLESIAKTSKATGYPAPKLMSIALFESNLGDNPDRNADRNFLQIDDPTCLENFVRHGKTLIKTSATYNPSISGVLQNVLPYVSIDREKGDKKDGYVVFDDEGFLARNKVYPAIGSEQSKSLKKTLLTLRDQNKSLACDLTVLHLQGVKKRIHKKYEGDEKAIAFIAAMGSAEDRMIHTLGEGGFSRMIDHRDSPSVTKAFGANRCKDFNLPSNWSAMDGIRYFVKVFNEVHDDMQAFGKVYAVEDKPGEKEEKKAPPTSKPPKSKSKTHVAEKTPNKGSQQIAAAPQPNGAEARARAAKLAAVNNIKNSYQKKL